MMTGEEGLQNVNDHLSHQSDTFTNLVGGGSDLQRSDLQLTLELFDFGLSLI